MHFDAELFHREATNPLLTAGDWPYPINSVFNPGARLHNGDTVLLCRDRGPSRHLPPHRRPVSKDGRTNWVVDAKPLIAVDPTDPHSCWGVEDPRITYVDELGGYVIAYTAYGPSGPCVALARTEDFDSVEPLGIVMPPEDKNASLLPRKIDGNYVLFHRPVSVLSARADVWLSKSADLQAWTTPEPVMQSAVRPLVGRDPDRHGPAADRDPARLAVRATTASSRWWRRRCTASA